MKQRYNELDGLRGIFCLQIVFYHYFCMNGIGNSQLDRVPKLIPYIYSQGYLGVEFFFMLSGFLMALTYRKKIENINFKDYIFKRINILYPSYLVSEIISIILVIIDQKWTNTGISTHSVNVWNVFRSFTMTYRGWLTNDTHPYNNVSWFVNVLLVCYIIYYFIVKFYNDNIKYTLCCFLVVVIGFYCFSNKFDTPFLCNYSGRGYMAFFIGCILVELYNMDLIKQKILYLLFVLVMGIIILAYSTDFNKVMGNTFLAYDFFIFPVLILSTISLKILKRIFSNIIFVSLGKISMGVFYTHLLILTALAMFNIYNNWDINFARWQVFGLFLITSIIVGTIWTFSVQRIELKKLIK